MALTVYGWVISFDTKSYRKCLCRRDFLLISSHEVVSESSPARPHEWAGAADPLLRRERVPRPRLDSMCHQDAQQRGREKSQDHGISSGFG